MNIHSRHFRLAVALNHTQKLPAVALIKARVVGDEINRGYSFLPAVLYHHMKQMPRNSSAAMIFFRVYGAHVGRQVFSVMEIVFNDSHTRHDSVTVKA